MRRIILLSLLLLVVIAGLMLGPLFVEYDGYILVVLEQGTLQLSLFGFLLSTLLLAVTGWILFWLFKRTIGLLSGSQQWLGSWSHRKQHKAFYEGLLALAEGNFDIARKQLAKVRDSNDYYALDLLARAESALQLGDPAQARQLWEQASDFDKAKPAAILSLVRQDAAQGDYQAALTRINSVKASDDNPAIIKAKVRLLAACGRWNDLKQALPGWKKTLGKDYDQWLERSISGEFEEIASKEGALPLKERWEQLSRSKRKDPVRLKGYARQLLAQGLHADAQDALTSVQTDQPDDELLGLFRQLTLSNPAKAIKRLEGWIKTDELNAKLYSTLAELAFRSGDLLLAEKAIAKAIKIENSPYDLTLMAQIQEKKSDNQQALQYYKQSLKSQ